MCLDCLLCVLFYCVSFSNFLSLLSRWVTLRRTAGNGAAGLRDSRGLCLGPPTSWRTAPSRGGDPGRAPQRATLGPARPGPAPPPGPYSPAALGAAGGAVRPPRRRGRHLGHWHAGRLGAGGPQRRFEAAARSRRLVGASPHGLSHAAR